MITNVEALKALYVKLGGALTDTYSDIAGGIAVSEYDLIADCILACAKKGGGSSLPTPGTAGNVLTSTGTDWESAAPADNDFIVTSALDISQMSITALSAATVAQMAVAAEAHKNIRLVATDDESGVVFSVDLNTYSDDASDFCGGAAVSLGDDTQMYCTVYISGQGTVSVEMYPLCKLPFASDNENGKILGVSDGVYTLVSPSALSNATLIVHGTISNGDFSFTDTTVKDVYDAKVANRAVFLDDGDGYRWELTGAVLTSDTYSISFGCLKHGVTKIIAAIIGISGTAETTTGGSVIESDLTPNA